MVNQQVQTLTQRFVDGTGFEHSAGGSVRSDATCWAILALEAARAQKQLIHKARGHLTSVQSKDGRVGLTPEHPEVYWPTALAILAWQGSPEHRDARTKAIRFIVGYSEILSESSPKEIIGYDTTIRGWSWTEKSYSWVEPTALAVIALRTAGHKGHRRVQDGVDLLMDRQFPDGGWNVGSTVVFGNALNPMPENTGMALQALSGLVPKKRVESSIRYLLSCVGRLRTPFTLGWSLLGLSAWGHSVEKQDEMVLNVLQQQDKHGPFDTASLGVFLLAQLCRRGLIDFLDRERQ
ncbi:MAG: hypothetical protein CEE38_07345 [Planctomycetes bacterium B3_Pla]|nr:MAG: hypothetical protein CEE38_07345 [Planctomycetes bacterium B3_Pla]